MKKAQIVLSLAMLLLFLLIMLTGCSGLHVSKHFSQKIDTMAATTASCYDLAEEDKLSEEEQVDVLRGSAAGWHEIVDHIGLFKGVLCTPKYRDLLKRLVVITDEMLLRAEKGLLGKKYLLQALRDTAYDWKIIKNAKDGVYKD